MPVPLAEGSLGRCNSGLLCVYDTLGLPLPTINAVETSRTVVQAAVKASAPSACLCSVPFLTTTRCPEEERFPLLKLSACIRINFPHQWQKGLPQLLALRDRLDTAQVTCEAVLPSAPNQTSWDGSTGRGMGAGRGLPRQVQTSELLASQASTSGRTHALPVAFIAGSRIPNEPPPCMPYILTVMKRCGTFLMAGMTSKASSPRHS